MSLKKVLNQQYGKILDELRTSFPEIVEIEDKHVEYMNIMENPELSDTIYDRLHIGLTEDIINRIHKKDPTLFDEDIGIVNETFGLLVFHRFGESEQEAYWNLLQNIIRFMVIIQNTGKSLPMFEDIAKSFMIKNNSIKPQDYQKELFSQLFTDKELTDKIINVFQDEETLTTLFGNMGNILHGIGLTGSKSNPPPPCEEKDKDTEYGRLFQKRRQKFTAKEIAKSDKNSIDELINMVGDIKLDPTQIKDIQQDICQSFSGTDIPNMLTMFQNTDITSILSKK